MSMEDNVFQFIRDVYNEDKMGGKQMIRDIKECLPRLSKCDWRWGGRLRHLVNTERKLKGLPVYE